MPNRVGTAREVLPGRNIWRGRLFPPLYGDCQEGTPIGQQAPRAARADRGGGSGAHERHLLSWDSFFVRPGAVSSSRPASFTEAPRAAAVKAGRRCVVTTSSGI